MNQRDKVISAKMSEQFIFLEERFQCTDIAAEDLIAFPLAEPPVDESEALQIEIVCDKAFDRTHHIFLSDFTQITAGIGQPRQKLGQCTFLCFPDQIAASEMHIQNIEDGTQFSVIVFTEGTPRHGI